MSISSIQSPARSDHPDPRLDVKALQEKVGFIPSNLLEIAMCGKGTTATVVVNGGSTGASMIFNEIMSFQLALTEVESGRAIWKAELSMDWPSGGFPSSGTIPLEPKLFADKILQQLQKDGLLNPLKK